MLIANIYLYLSTSSNLILSEILGLPISNLLSDFLAIVCFNVNDTIDLIFFGFRFLAF